MQAGNLKTDFKLDLANLLKQRLAEAGILHDHSMDVSSLASRYYEMMERRIIATPRRVHFSREIHDSLGKLAREANPIKRRRALEAWRTAFYIHRLLEEGENVVRFLSKKVQTLTSMDGILWDYGLHHLHLNRKVGPSGFVERSDYLLFAHITQESAYFVDVRLHPQAQGLGWVQQDLLEIARSNWPELIESKILRGVSGTILTDQEKQTLRRKRINHVMQAGDNAIAPIGGGMMMDGSSTLCRLFGMKLMHEIDCHQHYFDSPPSELLSQLEAKGVEIANGVQFQLAPLDILDLSIDVISSLQGDDCLSRDLCRMGFVIVESTKSLPIVVRLE